MLGKVQVKQVACSLNDLLEELANLILSELLRSHLQAGFGGVVEAGTQMLPVPSIRGISGRHWLLKATQKEVVDPSILFFCKSKSDIKILFKKVNVHLLITPSIYPTIHPSLLNSSMGTCKKVELYEIGSLISYIINIASPAHTLRICWEQLAPGEGMGQ